MSSSLFLSHLEPFTLREINPFPLALGANSLAHPPFNHPQALKSSYHA